jgi:riboflavin biosynthesis pyrimidine reductase
MASLVLKMSVSLDGFVAPLDGSSDWAAVGRSDDGASWTVETLSNASAHLIGDWPETTIATGDLLEAVTRLKAERPDGYLLAQGGTRFARSLVETGLIDEYRLVVHPVVLGAGEPLFSAALTIEPASTTVFSAGAVAHVFTAHP